MLRLFSLLVVLALVSLVTIMPQVHADVPADLITSLPGYTDKLPTRQWSGYLDGSPERNGSTLLHYWFVESARAPKTDPVVLYFIGGPGCSSLYSFFREHGPVKFTGRRDANGDQTLIDNPYSWNAQANMLYVEMPVGVGFSYYVNRSYSYSNDEITSQNNAFAVVDFFRKWPELAQNDFFIIGISYAGIYIPTLVDRLRNLPAATQPSLKGFAVGNSCLGNEAGTCAFDPRRNLKEYALGLYYNFKFFEGHAFVNPVSAANINRVCGSYNNISTSNDCLNALRRVPDVPRNSFDIYSLYNTCPSALATQSITMAPTVLGQDWLDQQSSSNIQSEHRHERASSAHDSSDDLTYQPECIPESVMQSWLNSDNVQAALHVSQANQKRWSTCTNVGYERTCATTLPLYPSLISQYRVLVYSGDTDACVPQQGSEHWVRSLGYKAQTAWHPWTVRNQQVGGYAVKYSANFTFATIKGAGHMAAEDEPETTFAMFSRWIAGQDL